MKFKPVETLEELASLNQEEVVVGYASAEAGDPEPGENRGRSFWHGWRNRMMDYGEIEHDDAARILAREFVKVSRH